MSQKNNLVKIPGIFHSIESGEPFKNCMNCNCDLLQEDTQYVIEKAIRQYQDYNATDTIFEYAICMKCHSEFIKSYSEKSLDNIQNYFMENISYSPQREDLKKKMEEEGYFNIEDWTSHCIIKGTSIRKLPEYQVGCHCIGNKMVVSGMPFVIGNKALDEISQLLSNKTIDQMNGFVNEFLGLPPDLRKLLPDAPVLII